MLHMLHISCWKFNKEQKVGLQQQRGERRREKEQQYLLKNKFNAKGLNV